LKPNIDQVTGRTGKWGEDEEIKLKDAVQTMAVQTHGGKNWDAIAALVPGRTKNQCRNRWHNITHGNKSWGEIAPLVPGRSEKQCLGRLAKVAFKYCSLFFFFFIGADGTIRTFILRILLYW
jgi:hypothetical protein